MSAVNRPSPLLATQRARVTVKFGPLKGSLLLAEEMHQAICERIRELGDAPEAEQEVAALQEQRKAAEEAITNLRAEGYIPWQLSGTMLSSLPAVEGHVVISLAQELGERFLRNSEGVPGVDADHQRISTHLLQNVALVYTAVQSIDGADPYTPEELLALAHNIEELWSLLLAEVLTHLGPNPT